MFVLAVDRTLFMFCFLTLLKPHLYNKTKQKHSWFFSFQDLTLPLSFTVNFLSPLRLWWNFKADWMTNFLCCCSKISLFHFRRFYSGHLACLFSSSAVCTRFCLCNHLYEWQFFSLRFTILFFIILHTLIVHPLSSLIILPSLTF